MDRVVDRERTDARLGRIVATTRQHGGDEAAAAKRLGITKAALKKRL